MKSGQIISIFLLAIFLTNLCAAENTTVITQTNNTSNPIAKFMQTAVSSESFKFIGAPVQITYQNLIIYLLFVLIAYIIIADILNSVNLFDKKWISNAIGLIVVLIGVYSGKTYELIIVVTKVGFTSIFAAAATPYIVLGVLGTYLIVRTFIRIVKKSDRINRDKIEAEAERLRTLRKVQDIEARAEGI
ncbi:MAG: hypothetical protein WCI72_03230 [archaeon]